MANINISQILMKRGNTAAAGNYIGPLGELVVDTGLQTVRVQDGVTPGGMSVLATLTAYNQVAANIANLQTAVTTITGLNNGFASNINTLLSNAASQSGDITTLYANAAAQANSIVALNANLSGFRTYANTTFGTSNYGNAQVAAYLIANPQGGIYSNANINAYLSASTIDGLSTSGNVTIGGNLFVNGNATTINAINLIVNDNIIYMANANPANSLDIGFAGHFNNGTYQHTGLVRQASTGQWKLFSNIVAEPSNTVDFSTAVYDAIQVGAISSPTITDLYSNAAVQSANIATLFSNAGVQADAITSLRANITAANIAIAAASGTYGNANVAAYLINNPQGGLYGDTNVAALLGAFGNNNISTTGTANIGSVNMSSGINWFGGSQVYEDTVLVAQGNVAVAITSPGDTTITAGTNTWRFGADGTATIPSTLTFDARGTNQRTGWAEALVFTKSGTQKSISTAGGTLSNPDVERLVIAGGDSYQDLGTGVFTPYSEGGDIYLWAGRGANGGDIKVDAGLASGVDGEEGGTIKIRGGSSTSGTGGFVHIESGSGNTNGEIRLTTPGHTWNFREDGVLQFPNGDWNINQQRYGMGNLVAFNDSGWVLGEYNGSNYGTEGMRIAPGIEGANELILPSDNNSATQSVQLNNYSTGGVVINSNGNIWTFGADGTTTLPGWTFGTDGAISATNPLVINVPNGVPTSVANWNGQGGWNQNLYSDLATTGGSGSGLTVDVAANGGGYINITAITIHTPGTGYTDGDVITIENEYNLASTFTIGVADQNSWAFGTDGTTFFPDGTNFGVINGAGTIGFAANPGSAFTIDTSGGSWQFGTSGNLTLPAGGTITEGGGITGAITLTPAGGANANQALVIYPTAAADGDHLHLTAGGGSTELYLGNDYHYVKLVDGGNVQIQAYNLISNSSAWTFGTDGNLTLPENANINYANGVNILSTVSSGSTYGNADVGAYLANYDGSINFTASPAVITGLGNISSANFTFGNGVNILSTVGTYGDSNVAAYLSAQTTGNVGAGNLIVVNNFNTNVITANSYNYANGISILDSINANIGAFQTYANTTFGTSSYGDSNVSAYLSNQKITSANIGGSQTYANTQIQTINANVTGANAAIVTANTAMKGYVDAVTTAWTTANSTQSTQITNLQSGLTAANAAIVTANSAVVSYVNTLTNSLATGANANTLAYLNSGFTVSGNITAGNIITSGTSGNITNVNVVSANSLQLNNNLTIAGSGTIGTNLYVLGNLQVSGTTTSVSQATLSVTDKIITVSNGSTTGSQANGAGISVAGANANLYYTAIGDQWNTNKPFYAPGIYDGTTRVVSTSSGSGNLTISGTAVSLPNSGPGAVTTGSATAIPVITTDAQGRIRSISTASVSSTLNTAGTSGTGTVSLTSQSLSVTGTNGLTATASGQTITLTDNLWPTANANLGTATTNISALQANVGSYYTWANANVAGLSSQITGANTAIVTANSAVVSYVNTLNTAMASNVASANAAIVTANTALKGYVDAGNTTQSNQINSINANIGSYYTWANANVAGLQTSITSLRTNANANTAAYLAAGISTNVTTTGNITAGNVLINGALTSYGVVNPAFIVVGQVTNVNGYSNGSTFVLDTVVGNVNSQTSYNASTGVFTLTAGVTYDMSFTPSFIGFSNTTGGFLCYQWVDATTNTPLDSTGIGMGTVVPTTDTSVQNDNTTARVIYTPSTNQTVKLYVSSGNGTANLRGGIGTQAIVRPLNLSVAVQATATGTVNNDYIQAGRITSAQTVSNAATPQDVIFNTTIATNSGIAHNTSTGVFTLTAGKTYELEAQLTYASMAANSNYILFTWVDATTNAALDTSGASVGSIVPTSWGSQAGNPNSSYGAISKVIYTPSTNQTVKVRITAGVGSGSIFAGQGTYAKITQINQAFALNSIKDLTVGTANTAGNLNVYGNITYNGAQVTTGNITTTVVSNTSPSTSTTNSGSSTSPGLTVMTLAIPTAGTWRLDAELRVDMTSGGYMAAAFYDNGTLIPNSEYWIGGGAQNRASGAGSGQYSGFMSYNLTTTGARTVTVGIWSTATTSMISSADGRTWARATQLDPSFTLSNQVAVGGNLSVGGNITATGNISATGSILAVPAWTSAGAITFGATTTAPTKPTTRVKDNISYRQLGAKQWEVVISWLVSDATGATNGTGDYLFTLPNSLQFDTTLPSQSVYTGNVASSVWAHIGYIIPSGSGLITNNSVGGQVHPMVYSSTQFRILGTTPSSGVAPWGSAFFALNSYTAMQLTFRFTSA